jgi:hypothetical protein
MKAAESMPRQASSVLAPRDIRRYGLPASSRGAAVLLAITLLAGLTGCPRNRPAAARPALPQIDFVYPAPDGTIFDIACEQWTDRPTDSARRQQVLDKLPEMRAEWEHDGPALLALAMDATGTGFPHQQMQATLTVCLDTPMAMPLLIAVGRYLPGSDVVPSHDFALLVFHELMHHHVMPLTERSALRAKYAGENLQVLDHLHVLALEQYVLTQLGRHQAYAQLQHAYARNPASPYKRAWEIVEAEGAEAFIAELRRAVTPPGQASAR